MAGETSRWLIGVSLQKLVAPTSENPSISAKTTRTGWVEVLGFYVNPLSKSVFVCTNHNHPEMVVLQS